MQKSTTGEEGRRWRASKRASLQVERSFDQPPERSLSARVLTPGSVILGSHTKRDADLDPVLSTTTTSSPLSLSASSPFFCPSALASSSSPVQQTRDGSDERGGGHATSSPTTSSTSSSRDDGGGGGGSTTSSTTTSTTTTTTLITGVSQVGERKRLFDCVLVVSLNTKLPMGAKNPPYVTHHFPYPPSFMKAVTQFCFPDVGSTDKMKRKEVFSFVLTESNGEKRWGYCHRVFPECYCIISYFPCFSIFQMILKKVIKLHQSATPAMPFSNCSVFLRAIYEQPLPPPGGTLQFSVEYPPSSGKKAKVENYTFRRPDDSDSLLDHVLYPLSWQHVFIPVLPSSLLSFCCAPMPFVVGVLRSSVEELKALSRNMEEVVIIDLDDDRVIPPGSETDAALLPPFVEPLRNTIEEISKRTRGRVTLTGIAKKGKLSKETTSALVNSFIGFMVDLLSSYRQYIITVPTLGSDELVAEFRREDFLDASAKDARKLLELVTETQMFAMFIEQRCVNNKPRNGVFDRSVNDKTCNGNQHENAPSKPPPRLRPAHTRFTMYEYGNITRSEISAVHQMIRDAAEKSKKDIDEQESLELLRKWREEEKRRKEQEVLANTSIADVDSKKPVVQIVGRSSQPLPASVADPEERARARGEAFLSIRVTSRDNPRQALLANSRVMHSPDVNSSRTQWKRANVSNTPTSPPRSTTRRSSFPENVDDSDSESEGSSIGSEILE